MRLDTCGEKDFVHKVDKEFDKISVKLDKLIEKQLLAGDVPIKDLYTD